MEISAIASSMSQIDIQTGIGCALMENVKEMIEIEGEALTEMLDSVPTPAGVGGHIDISL